MEFLPSFVRLLHVFQFAYMDVTSLQPTLQETLQLLNNPNRNEVSDFQVWWNVPTAMCHKYGLNFSEVEKFGLVQNKDDMFIGNAMAILYDPGLFPALKDNKIRNNGVPQEADLDLHLSRFEEDLKRDIPDSNFSGLGVIDFEEWRPIWRENWGKLDEYRKYSIKKERERHPNWSADKLEDTASRRFEKAAYRFFDETLATAKRLRPLARWGYYGFPFCFNYTPKNRGMYCSTAAQKDTDRSGWLFETSTALYPSIYLHKSVLKEWQRQSFIEGRLLESSRVAAKASPRPLPVIPYATFRYPDSAAFLSQRDMTYSIVTPKKYGASGVIIWGSSKDTSSKDKCTKLLDYVREVIRPIVKQLN